MVTKQILYVNPENISTQKISILEKINRLSEMNDPNLCDVNNLQHYATQLGYDVGINRSDLGNLAALDGSTEIDVDAEKYMRFALSNLPLWYNIKTTRNAIKIMLYSFGIVGDISQYFTNKYDSTGDWVSADYDQTSDSLASINPSYFPTPHFIIWSNIIDSDLNTSVQIDKREQILKAINSIRPINTVFRRFGGYSKIETTVTVTSHTRFHSRYIRLVDEASDSWAL